MKTVKTTFSVLLWLWLHSSLQIGFSYAFFAARRGSNGQLRPIAIETSSSTVDNDDDDEHPRRVLIAMDCLCSYHGGYLTTRALDIPGVSVVHVLSGYMEAYLRSTGAADETDLQARKRPTTAAEARLFLDSIIGGGKNDVEITAVYCESDSGLHDAELLRELLAVTCVDDPIVHEPRRDKSRMYQVVADAGLSVAKSKLCCTAQEAVEFASYTTDKVVVIKPFRGVASESVFLCKTDEDILAAWDHITSTQIFGSAERHSSVLAQEFLEGVEYAVDVVSRCGDHKVAAVWRYVKRPANGAPFCYFKTELVDLTMDENVKEVCAYVLKSLDALGVGFGISHNEVIVRERTGPALIEVNMRQHNMDFAPLTMACIGYNKLDMLLVALFLDDKEWSSVPDMPVLRAFGCMAHLVNMSSGKLLRNHHLDEMAGLTSVFDYEVYDDFRTPGTHITPTIDIRTDAGWVQMINPDKRSLEQDYEQIEEWMKTMFETQDEPAST